MPVAGMLVSLEFGSVLLPGRQGMHHLSLLLCVCVGSQAFLWPVLGMHFIRHTNARVPAEVRVRAPGVAVLEDLFVLRFFER